MLTASTRSLHGATLPTDHGGARLRRGAGPRTTGASSSTSHAEKMTPIVPAAQNHADTLTTAPRVALPCRRRQGQPPRVSTQALRAKALLALAQGLEGGSGGQRKGSRAVRTAARALREGQTAPSRHPCRSQRLPARHTAHRSWAHTPTDNLPPPSPPRQPWWSTCGLGRRPGCRRPEWTDTRSQSLPRRERRSPGPALRRRSQRTAAGMRVGWSAGSGSWPPARTQGW